MTHESTDPAPREGTEPTPPDHDQILRLEVDETVPPRPEEEVADVTRSEPGEWTASP
ncbi:hypothetical protein J4G33_01115 [Actinotalea sp. BY-33]|uniref:Uncharacterized protein n=1 Tax=Actinotalea soli TaxID=2819234 RepID=A0A939RU97_9CELL|nr:hypothetical protein [Actinotalea soli]MBO1750398.1 hypothetical protein [Actinotalea soli]